MGTNLTDKYGRSSGQVLGQSEGRVSIHFNYNCKEATVFAYISVRNNILKIRRKYGNRLNTEHDMRTNLSVSSPYFSVRMTGNQVHPVAGCCGHGDEPSGSIKGAEFTD